MAEGRDEILPSRTLSFRIGPNLSSISDRSRGMPKPPKILMAAITFATADIEYLWEQFYDAADGKGNIIAKSNGRYMGDDRDDNDDLADLALNLNTGTELIERLDENLWGMGLTIPTTKIRTILKTVSEAARSAKAAKQSTADKISGVSSTEWVPKLMGYGAGVDSTTMLAVMETVNFQDFVQACNQVKFLAAETSTWYHFKFPLDPDSSGKQGWDFLLMMFLLFTCFAVPYQLAFDTPPGNIMTPYNSFDVLVDCLFMLDVLVNFFTSYYSQGTYVDDFRSIALNYCSTWFAIDVAGSFPFDKVILAMGTSNSTADLSSLRILKAVRMLKLMRAIKLMGILGRLQEKEEWTNIKRSISLFKAFFSMLYTAHFLGCAFHMLIDDESSDPESSFNWRNSYDPSLQNEEEYHKYVAALYWACVTVTTLGYGDVVPVTHEERQFACFGVLVGSCVFAYGLGNITSLISTSSGVTARFDSHLAAVTEWMKYRQLPKEVQLEVKRHLYSSVRRSPALYLEREILDRMHGRLRSMVLGELKPPSGWSPSSEVSLLHGFSQQLKGRFWTEVDCMLLLEGEVIYKFGSIGDRCFFIASGTVEVFRHTNLDPFDAVTPVHDNVSEVLSEGAYFGLTSMFKDICQTRLETVVCCSKEARVLTLSTHSVAAMCDEFPEFQENLRILAQMELIKDRRGNLGDSTMSRVRMRQLYEQQIQEGCGQGQLSIHKRIRMASEAVIANIKRGLHVKHLDIEDATTLPGARGWSLVNTTVNHAKEAWLKSKEAWQLMSEEEWNNMCCSSHHSSGSTHFGTTLFPCPIPVHPSFDPSSEDNKKAAGAGARRGSKNSTSLDISDVRAFESCGCSKLGRTESLEGGGFAPLDSKSEGSRHRFERWQYRSYAIMANGVVVCLPYTLETIRSPQPVPLGYLTLLSDPRVCNEVVPRRGREMVSPSMSKPSEGRYKEESEHETGHVSRGSKLQLSVRVGVTHSHSSGFSVTPSDKETHRYISRVTLFSSPETTDSDDGSEITFGFEDAKKQNTFMAMIDNVMSDYKNMAASKRRHASDGGSPIVATGTYQAIPSDAHGLRSSHSEDALNHHHHHTSPSYISSHSQDALNSNVENPHTRAGLPDYTVSSHKSSCPTSSRPETPMLPPEMLARLNDDGASSLLLKSERKKPPPLIHIAKTRSWDETLSPCEVEPILSDGDKQGKMAKPETIENEIWTGRESESEQPWSGTNTGSPTTIPRRVLESCDPRRELENCDRLKRSRGSAVSAAQTDVPQDRPEVAKLAHDVTVLGGEMRAVRSEVAEMSRQLSMLISTLTVQNRDKFMAH